MTDAQLRVIIAAVSYCEGTNPDEDPLDTELRASVAELTKQNDD